MVPNDLHTGVDLSIYVFPLLHVNIKFYFSELLLFFSSIIPKKWNISVAAYCHLEKDFCTKHLVESSALLHKTMEEELALPVSVCPKLYATDITKTEIGKFMCESRSPRHCCW